MPVPDLPIVAFAAIVFASYALQTITGFGSTLLLVTFGAHLLPIPEIVALAVPISVMQSSYIGVRHRSGIDWSTLSRVPIMGAGLAAGFLLLRSADASWMEIAFALLVLVLAVREILTMVIAERRSRSGAEVEARAPMSRLQTGGWLLIAGVVHGVYATGGPLVVYALGRSGLNKTAFRSTLAIIWLVLDLALTISFAIDGRYDEQSLWRLAIIAPAVPLGVLVGEALHHRVDERRFKYLVFGLLVAGALSLLVRAG